jgi:hypothetical protein
MMAQSQVVQQDDVNSNDIHPDDVAIYEQLAKLQDMFDNVKPDAVLSLLSLG